MASRAWLKLPSSHLSYPDRSCLKAAEVLFHQEILFSEHAPHVNREQSISNTFLFPSPTLATSVQKPPGNACNCLCGKVPSEKCFSTGLWFCFSNVDEPLQISEPLWQAFPRPLPGCKYLGSLTQHFNPHPVLQHPTAHYRASFPTAWAEFGFMELMLGFTTTRKLKQFPSFTDIAPLKVFGGGTLVPTEPSLFTPCASLLTPPILDLLSSDHQQLLSIFGSSFHSSDLPLGAGLSRDSRNSHPGKGTRCPGQGLGSIRDPCTDAGTDLSDSREGRDQERRKSWQVSSWDSQGREGGWPEHPAFSLLV